MLIKRYISFLLGIKIVFIHMVILIILLSSTSEALIEVEDFRGRKLTLKKPVERVVCLIESGLTGIYMLKRHDRIVGVPTNVYDEGYYYKGTFEYYSMLDESIRLKKIPAVGNWESVNIEKVLSLKPDLIIIWSNQAEVAEKFEKLGVPIYGVFITKIDDVYKEILDFGRMLDADTRAHELVEYVKEELRKIIEVSKNIREKRKVYFSWAQIDLLKTSCGESIVNELINLVGAVNVCSDIKLESVSLNMEELVSRNPDVIVMWHSKSLGPSDLFKNNQLRTVNAVKNKSVYQFDDTFSFDLWTLKFIYALKFMANKIYPEFYHYNLEEEYRKIFSILYGKDLDSKI